MRSLLMRDGDLVLGTGGFATVNGAAKLRQDLGVALRETFGTDRFHPQWGSLLGNYVGSIANEEASALIRGEVSRVIQNHMMIQRDELQRSALSGRKPRYGSSEIISDIVAIDVRQHLDRYDVTVTLMTLSREQIVLTTTVGGDGVA